MDRRGFDLLRKQAVAKTAPGGHYGTGVVIGYCDAPQVLIRRPDGSTFWWRADLCQFMANREDARQDVVE